jgi:hypothetical protein
VAVTGTNLGSSAAPDFESTTDGSLFANVSWTPPTCDLILLWVFNTRSTDLGSAGAVSGNGLTWTQIQTVGRDAGTITYRLTLYAADARSGASAGQTTVSFAGDTQTSVIMEFQRVDGVDLSGGVAAAFVQTPTNNNTSTNLAITLSAASDIANRFFAAIGHGTNENHTVEAGWDELDDLGGFTPGHALVSFWDSDSVADLTPSASWTTSGAAVGIAIEIKASPSVIQTGGGTVTTSDTSRSMTTSDTSNELSTSDSSSSVEVEDL